MLLIKTFLAPSKIQGMGLFAGEDIKKGQVTWKYNPKIDIPYSKEEIKHFPKLLKDFIKKYASLSIKTNNYILCCDDARFTNHSSNPNLASVDINGEIEPIGQAKRDIKKGEELTIDYRTFDKDDAANPKGYLKD